MTEYPSAKVHWLLEGLSVLWVLECPTTVWVSLECPLSAQRVKKKSQTLQEMDSPIVL